MDSMDIKNDIMTTIDDAAHRMADDLAYVDQASFLRGVTDRLLGAEPDPHSVDDRYYRAGYKAADKAF